MLCVMFTVAACDVVTVDCVDISVVIVAIGVYGVGVVVEVGVVCGVGCVGIADVVVCCCWCRRWCCR